MSKNLNMKKDCEYCGKPFKVTPTTLKAGRKCCSHACSKAFLWSKPEYRQHMKEAHKGFIPTNIAQLTEYIKSEAGRCMARKNGKKNGGWNKGMELPQISGSNHYLWKSNREELVKSEKKHLDGKYRDWMRAVKNRDGWACRIANGDCSGRLEAHHILRWSKHPELRYEINNGITLCVFHHPKKIDDEVRLSPYFKELVGKAH